MAEKDSQGPSLELPSLFRRKRGAGADEPEGTSPPAPEKGAAGTEPTPRPASVEAPTDSPTDPAETAETADDTAADTTEDTAVLPVAEERPTVSRPRLTLPSVKAPRTSPRDRDAVPPAQAPTPAPAPEAPAPSAGRADDPTVEQAPVRPTAPAAAVPDAPAASARPAPVAGRTATREREATTAPTQPEQPPSEERERRRPSVPALAATTAALAVGAVVGLLGVVLTFLGLQGCELIAGTSSCGGPGLLVLVAIFVAMVLAGAAALKLFRVPEAGSVSFLGTGLLSVILLFFFLGVLDHPSMIVVIPAVAAPCYALARWVTTQLGEDVMAER